MGGAGLQNPAGPARLRQARGHRPLHNPSPDRPKASLVTHGVTAPPSDRALRCRGPGKLPRSTRKLGLWVPRHPGLRWGSYWAGKANSVLGDPGLLKLGPAHAGGLAQAQRSRPVHTPEEGGGVPQTQPGLSVPATWLVQPSIRNLTCQEEGVPYLWDTLALWPFRQPHDPTGQTCG